MSITLGPLLTDAIPESQQEEVGLTLHALRERPPRKSRGSEQGIHVPMRTPHERHGIRLVIPVQYESLRSMEADKHDDDDQYEDQTSTASLPHYSEGDLLDLGYPAFYAALCRVNPHGNHVSVVYGYKDLDYGRSTLIVVCHEGQNPWKEFQRSVFGLVSASMEMSPEEYAEEYRINCIYYWGARRAATPTTRPTSRI